MFIYDILLGPHFMTHVPWAGTLTDRNTNFSSTKMHLKMSSCPFCPGWGESTWFQKSMHCLFFCFCFYCHQVDIVLSELNTGYWRQSLHIRHKGYDTEMSKNSFCFSAHDIFVLYIVWTFFFMSRSLTIGWILVILENVIRWCHPGGIISPVIWKFRNCGIFWRS